MLLAVNALVFGVQRGVSKRGILPIVCSVQGRAFMSDGRATLEKPQ